MGRAALDSAFSDEPKDTKSLSKKRRGAATAAVNDPLPLREKSHTNTSHTHETRPRKNSRAPPEVMERAQRRDHHSQGL